MYEKPQKRLRLKGVAKEEERHKEKPKAHLDSQNPNRTSKSCILSIESGYKLRVVISLLDGYSKVSKDFGTFRGK